MRPTHILLPQRTVLALVFLMFLGSMVRANEPIKLRPGFATVLKLDRPAGTVVVGDPSVADAVLSDPKTIVLTAKKTDGVTNVIALDNEKNEFFNATVSVSGHKLDQVNIYSKGYANTNGGLHSFSAYHCDEGGCWKVKDEFEGPLPSRDDTRVTHSDSQSTTIDQTVREPPPRQ